MKCNLINISLFSLLVPSLLSAAELPNIGDAMRQANPPRDVEKPKSDIPILQGQEPSAVTKNGDSDKKVLIKRFVISGAEHISVEELNSIVAPYENKELSFLEMENVAQVITNTYRKRGYFVARAVVPKQNIFAQDGQLKIGVVEGRYGKFTISNKSLVSQKRVQSIFDDIKDRDIVSNESLERALLIANETPSLKVNKADVKQGKEPETSDFDIVAEAASPYGASVTADNYGSKYTGRYKLNIGLNANSPFGYGDKLAMNVLFSTSTDLINGKLSYNVPLMSNGLRGELSASKTTYSLAEDYKALDALGDSIALEASLIYPIIKTKRETLDITLSYAHKDMTDEVRSVSYVNKKVADVANLGLSYMKNGTLFGLTNTTNTSFTFTHGNLKINSADVLASDQSGAKTNGAYSKIGVSVENTLEFNSIFSLSTTFKFQKSLGNKNLDGGEDFSLGGAYGVKAFPDGEYSAENGYLVGAELFYNLPKYKGVSQKTSLFVDTGYATMENPIAATDGKQLADIGLSYQASFKDFFAKAHLARVIGGEQSEVEDKETTRFLLQIGWTY